MTPLVPCLLERKIVPKVWGGRALEGVLGMELPPGEKVGETWELYDRPGDSSRLRGSETTLADLMAADPTGLLGGGVEPAPGGHFPLAIKFVDAAEALSVQVHPADDQAAEVGQCGKAEAWVILQAGPNGTIRRGLKEGVTRDQFAGVAATHEVLELVETFSPRRGDAIHVPPGTVHAIGPEVALFEIQRNSDLTYRIYDWGRDRETHLEAGLRAARFDRPPETTVEPEPIASGAEWLIRDPHFRVRRITADTAFSIPTDGTFAVLTIVEGSCVLGWQGEDDGAPLQLETGDTALVPACTEQVFVSPTGKLGLLVSDPGAAD